MDGCRQKFVREHALEHPWTNTSWLLQTLPELLRQVKAGKRFTITNRGEAVSDLVRSEAAPAIDARAAIERFQAFLRDNPVDPGRRLSVKTLIEEARE